MSQAHRNWLVTGCSTGLGRALAEVLIERGERVFTTARKLEDLTDLVEGHENATALQLDVTKPDEVAAAIAAIEAAGGVDVLVNNAGYGLLVAIEEA
ncbi:SDR family NAD(P)-dependent oxidoreductase, partial [bacterium]